MDAATLPRHDVKDLTLAGDGSRRIEWAERDMPVLRAVRQRLKAERPFERIRVSACLHVTAETANLMRTLREGGAEVVLCASNPLSTQDDVAASLVVDHGVSTFAIRGEDHETYYAHVHAALDHEPNITMENGADLVGVLHAHRRGGLAGIIAGTEETATGVIRLKAIEAEGVLQYPVIAVNEAQTKQLFDNRYGTGQSVIDGILRATNILLAGRTFVVAGYGWCGRGIADRARGMGARVIVVEVDPLRGMQAVMDGFEVMPIAEAAPIGDVFCTATGCNQVVRSEHFAAMRDGAILANAGHFNVEIDIAGLASLAVERRPGRDDVELFVLADGRRIGLVAEGRIVNLAAAEGHPASVMDVSFAIQVLSIEYAIRAQGQLERKVYAVPDEIDREVARLKLAATGVTIDALTDVQARYLESWKHGT